MEKVIISYSGYMKKLLVLFFIAFFTVNSFAENVRVIVDITNVAVNDGKVYLAVFFNAEEFRKEEPAIAFELESRSATLSQEVSLPPGEYVISAFQDRNGNQRLDFNLIGVPRELVGISNYNGRGFPSRSFDRQKIPVDNTTGRVTIGLYRF